MLTGPDMVGVGRTLRALSNPWRRAMLEIAAVNPSNAATLGQYLPVRQPTAAYHLEVLQDAKLLRLEWEYGSQLAYTPNTARLEQLKRYIDECLMPSSYREQLLRPPINFAHDEESEAGLTRRIASLMG